MFSLFSNFICKISSSETSNQMTTAHYFLLLFFHWTEKGKAFSPFHLIKHIRSAADLSKTEKLMALHYFTCSKSLRFVLNKFSLNIALDRSNYDLNVFFAKLKLKLKPFSPLYRQNHTRPLNKYKQNMKIWELETIVKFVNVNVSWK